jgi:basic membrane protein A
MESRLSSLTGRLQKYNTKLEQAKTGQDKVGNSSKKASKGIEKTGKASQKAQKPMNDFGKSLKFALKMFGMTVMFQAFTAITSSVKEGFQNLALYSDSFNNSASALMSSLTQLKNAFATAFAPIAQAVIPYIQKFIDYVVKAAKDHPDVYFGHCSGYQTAENLSTYFGKIYQARYLAGIAAGMKTKADKIGYVAAFPIPEVIRGINAFTLGVQSVNPDATVEVIWTNTWYDPAVEKQAAIELLNKGCDVMAQHQDSTATQIAAQEKGAFAVGYNTSTPDAAPNAYLTAPLFHWEKFYVDDVQKLMDGTWTSRSYWEGLASGMVSLDDLTKNCAEGTADAVAAAQAKIESGELEPFTGPIADQSGTVKVAQGTKMTDEEIWNMGWFIKGVIGTIPQ